MCYALGLMLERGFRHDNSFFPGIPVSQLDSVLIRPPTINTKKIESTETSKNLWEWNTLLDRYESICSRIGNDYGDIYPDVYRHFLVKREDIIPDNNEKLQQIVHGVYNSQLEMESYSGRSFIRGDGTAVILIGYLGMEDKVKENVVMEVLAHETGHTLEGKLLDSVFEEEMKAHAFTQLFCRYLMNLDAVQVNEELLNPDYVLHDAAHLRISQLLKAGLNEEAILAHLTGKNFGPYTPDTWQEMVRV